jgi:nicotinic acid phosphoribosyltransferase
MNYILSYVKNCIFEEKNYEYVDNNNHSAENFFTYLNNKISCKIIP